MEKLSISVQKKNSMYTHFGKREKKTNIENKDNDAFDCTTHY